MGENVELTDYQSSVLSFVTKELLFGKRPHELLLLESYLGKEKISEASYLQLLEGKNCYVNDAVLESVDKVLSLEFLT